MINRVCSLFNSYVTVLKYKILYRSRFSCKLSLRVGKDFRIRIAEGGFVVIGDKVKIRDNVIINSTGGKILIGDEVFINDNVCINSRNRITIDKRTIIGQNVLFYDHDHDYRSSSVRDNYVTGQVYVGKDSWIGAQCSILRDSYIGNHCVIGAQTLLKDKVADNILYYQRREKIEKEIIHEL